MFSKELENLIEATLADGILEDNEKAALVKRAQAEGVDLAELEIYIQSIIQRREQNERVQLDKETASREKERKGNVCPHCGTPIPPLTKICPNCQRVVAVETTGDKEMFVLIDQITKATVNVKSATTSTEFKKAKAECEALLKKANLFYGDNKKVQMLVFDLQNEMSSSEKKLAAELQKETAKNILSNKWFWIAVEIIVIIITMNCVDSANRGVILILGVIAVIVSVSIALKKK